MADKQPKFPWGLPSTLALTADGAQAITIKNNLVIIDGVTAAASGNRTLNLTIDQSIEAGAMIFAKLKTSGTETTAFGTGMTGATLTGAAGKTKTVIFIYDGTTFVEACTPVQVD